MRLNDESSPDPVATDGAIRLSEYLETPESEWLHTEIERQHDDYPVSVELPGPEKPVVIMTNSGHDPLHDRGHGQDHRSRIAR